MKTRVTGFGYRSKTREGKSRSNGDTSGLTFAFILCLILLQGTVTYIAVDIYSQLTQEEVGSHE